MCVITVLFLAMIFFSCFQRSANILMNSIRDDYVGCLESTDCCLESPDCMEQTCPYLQVIWYTDGIIVLINLLILVLIIYISDQFGLPLDQHWKNFL